jgi:hypothetical protein
MKPVKVLLPIFVLSLVLIRAGATEPQPNPTQRPNVLFDVSAALLNAAMQQSTDETEPVDDVIQDTPVHGIARSVGTVGAVLVPDDRHGVIDMAFRGCVWSRTIGTRRTIRIHTFTTTPVETTRRVVLDERGIRVFPGPCRAHATTELLGINSTMDFDRAALCWVEKGYWRDLCAAEAESAHKTLQRVSERFDAELTPTLTSASQAIGRELTTIKRLGLTLDSLRFQTSGATLQASALISSTGREPSPVPQLSPDADLAVRVHESFFNSVALSALGGFSFPLDNVSKVYHEATRGMLRDGRKEADQAASLKRIERLLAALAGSPVTITLAKDDPLMAHFGDQEFTVEVHVGSVQQGKESFAGLRHKATYRLENGKEGVQAVRKVAAQTTADPAQPKQKLAALSKTSLLLHHALFAEVFPERLALTPLPLPANVRLAGPQGTARDGWLKLTWKLAP